MRQASVSFHLASAFASTGYLQAVLVYEKAALGGRLSQRPYNTLKGLKAAQQLARDRIMANLGYVGLGVMGGRMADRLMTKGTRSPAPTAPKSKAQWLIDKGMKWADTPRGVAESADVVFSMVTDSAALDDRLRPRRHPRRTRVPARSSST